MDEKEENILNFTDLSGHQESFELEEDKKHGIYLHNMNLHDVVKIRDYPKYDGYLLSIRRVPNGWIYEYRTAKGKLKLQFVPYDLEFLNTLVKRI